MERVQGLGYRGENSYFQLNLPKYFPKNSFYLQEKAEKE